MSDVYKILKLEKMCSGWHSSRGKGLQSERVLGLIPVKVSTFFPLDFGFFYSRENRTNSHYLQNMSEIIKFSGHISSFRNDFRGDLRNFSGIQITAKYWQQKPYIKRL